jgi:zeta-carotene desaturase
MLMLRQWSEFDNIYKLKAVPVATVQLRFDGWVTELQDEKERKQLDHAAGLDNLLYSSDVDFSCFADLALASPKDYYREGQGSLIQLVLTPGDPFIKMSQESPGMDPYRPDQKTPVGNFFVAGSYTQQDYIDSMEGATLSGRRAARAILEQVDTLAKTAGTPALAS